MKTHIYYILALVLLFSTSCEDVIEVKLNDEDINLYAVEAKITTEDEPYVYLYKGIPVSNDGGFSGVSNALVKIRDSQNPSNSIILTESDLGAGLYVVPEDQDYFGIPGLEYTLTIELADVILTATEYLDDVVPIDSIQVRPSLRGDNRFLGVFTYGKETLGLGDYYKWDIYVNDTLLSDAENIVLASDEFVDGNYINSLEIFTDFHRPQDKTERSIKFMDEVQVKQISISEFAYNYYYQMYEQDQTGFLFSVPPANITGNIQSSDGKEVLGLFTAHDVSRSNIVLVDDSIESQLDERP